MNLKSTIVGIILLLISQIKLITSQELTEYGPTSPTREAREDLPTISPGETKATFTFTPPSFERLYPEVTSIATRSFTSLPCNENSSEKLYSWSRNETSLSLFWFPSTTTKFTHYIVSIEPPDSVEPIQIFKKKNIKSSDKVNVVFTDLHSSTFYNISLKKAYGAKILSETYKNWTTPPAQPLNLYVDESSITPKSFRIVWDTEQLSSGADHYKLTVKIDEELYFYTILEGDHEKSYEFGNFRSDTDYIIELTTVFNDESSNPAVTSVFLPNKNNQDRARPDYPSLTTSNYWSQPTDEVFDPVEDVTASEESTSKNINNNYNINLNRKKKAT